MEKMKRLEWQGVKYMYEEVYVLFLTIVCKTSLIIKVDYTYTKITMENENWECCAQPSWLEADVELDCIGLS